MGVGVQLRWRACSFAIRAGICGSVCSKMVDRVASARAAPPGGGRTRKPAPSARPEEEAPGVSRLKIRIFAIFVACLLIPGSFFLAGARFTPYRAFLLIAFVPLLIQFLRGAAGRFTNVDLLVILYGAWITMSMLVHLGVERIDFIVIQLVEAICGYLVGRVLVRNAAEYRVFFRCFFWGLLALLPFAILEMLTKTNLTSQIAGTVLQPYPVTTVPQRFGLNRAQSAFEHPILFGLFCSLGFANALCIFKGEKTQRMFWTGVVFLTTFTALSSAPLLAIFIQTAMLTWDRIVQAARSKWFLLVAVGGGLFLFLELVTPNGAVDFLISTVTLNPASGNYRLETFRYVFAAIARYPLFGVDDFADVGLPWWHTGSIDNFWLVTAIEMGLPAALFLFCAIVLHLIRTITTTGLDETASTYRTGHFIAIPGLIFLLVTVHIWGAANVMIMAYIGAGAWIYAPQTAQDPQPRRRAAAAAQEEPPPAKPPAGKPQPVRAPAAEAARDRTKVRGSTGRYGGGRP